MSQLIDRPRISTSADGPMREPSRSPAFRSLGLLPLQSTSGSCVISEDLGCVFLFTPPTTSGEVPEDLDSQREETGSAIMALRRLTGLTWEQLARIFGVARRSLHFWASGKPLNTANEERLYRFLAAIRAVDRGTSSENRSLILREREGVIPFDLLLDGDHAGFVDLVGRGDGRPERKLQTLSEEAMDARRPRPPEELADSLQDRVHLGKGKARLLSAKPIRPKREE